MPRSSSATRRRRPSTSAERAQKAGYRAVKCGWGPFGRGTVKDDADHLNAAREGIGEEGTLLIDAGQIFGEDVEAAAARLPYLEDVHATWFEEPFNGSAYEAYGALGRRRRPSSLPAARRRITCSWPSTPSTTAASASSRSIAAGSAASGRRSRSRTTRWRRASPTSTTPSPRIWRFALRSSRSPD